MDSRRLILYFRRPPEVDRWFPGDRWLRPIVRRIVRGKHRMGGLDKVFFNLTLGLREIGQPFLVNLPFGRLVPGDRIVFLGIGPGCFGNYARKDPVVAGIGILNHPRECPDLCERYPIVRFLQASEWACDLYRPVFGDRCAVWPVGIDTVKWRPMGKEKTFDYLIYDKIRWDQPACEETVLKPILETLKASGCSHRLIRYGHYAPEEYADALARCRAMIFLSDHESQGIAYQEALSSGVPILAWNRGVCLDPSQFDDAGNPHASTSVPYFDDRCGTIFGDAGQFRASFPEFSRKLAENKYNPRGYVLENLTLAHSARTFVRLVEEAL